MRDLLRLSHRDLFLLFLGFLFGIPSSIFASYAYDWLNKKDLALEVQGLYATNTEFAFQKSQASRSNRDGFIEIRYRDASKIKSYSCVAILGDGGEIFEFIKFEEECKKIVFRFKSIREVNISRLNNVFHTATFTVRIKSERGEVWEGTQSISYIYFNDL